MAVYAKVKILGFWWENPLPYQQTPKGLRSLRAEDCGVCHADIYREWKLSTHAHALSDLQFQEEMKKSPETRWLCLNCHTPLENQLGAIAVGVRNQSTKQPVLQKNPRYDARLESEAVTCAVCHVRDGYVLGPYGDSKAPHPVKKEPKLLTADTCAQCHQATAAYTDTLVCTFNTAEEWRASPYAAKGQTCQHCHMPAVERPAGLGGKPRPGRKHYFVGSMVPKEYDPKAPRRALNPENLFRTGLEVNVSRWARAGADLDVFLELRNAHAGHMLPTGDPERYLLVNVTLLAGGKPAGSGSLRLGQVWEWWPKARQVSDNRLKPGASRIERVRFAGAARSGAREVEISVTHVRINDEAARYHKLIGRYPTEALVARYRKALP